MYFETSGAWMGRIIMIRTKAGNFLKNLNLDEAEGDEELTGTWIDKDGSYSTKYVLLDRTFESRSVIAAVTAPTRNAPWRFPDGWYDTLTAKWKERAKPPKGNATGQRRNIAHPAPNLPQVQTPEIFDDKHRKKRNNQDPAFQY